MTIMHKEWWQKPLRIISTNLQVADTDRIDPERLAEQVIELGGNALVFNAAGVYAWYDTAVPFHTKNEFLPKDEDLLGKVIDSCHRRGIRFIARCNFARAEDTVYLQKPQWFVKNQQNEPKITAPERPGKWPLLMSTCINGAYQNDAVAKPVINEILDRYEVDGFFINSFFHVPCYCEVCRKKYKSIYHCELPADPDMADPAWEFRCMHDAMDSFSSFVKNKTNNRVPMFFYCYPFISQENPTDILCAEVPNLLSNGHQKLSEVSRPAFSMKMVRSLSRRASPIGIVHTCPGLQWRHIGIPPAEHLLWMSQVPANGGQIWHGITGVPDTVRDIRILDSVKKLNHMVAKVESYMEDAEPASQVAMLWRDRRSMKGWYASDGRSMEGWADGLTTKQIPYEIVQGRHVTIELLQKYKVVIIPEGFEFTPEIIEQITGYVEQGGNVICEGRLQETCTGLFDLTGIEQDVFESQKLAASYLRFSGSHNPLQKGLEHTEMIAHHGTVYYCSPKGESEVLATLVPPFSPLDGIGAPPERASIPVPYTDLPLCLVNQRKKGKVVYFPFSFSEMINEYRLEEYYIVLGNTVDMLMGEDKRIKVGSGCPGLQVSSFQKENHMIINLINGTGRRPLVATVPIHDIRLEVKLTANENVREVRQLIAERPAAFIREGNILSISVDKIDVWESLLIEFS